MDDRFNEKNKNELDDILSEFVIKGKAPSDDEDISSLADKYQVDVSDIKPGERLPEDYRPSRRRTSPSRERSDYARINPEPRSPRRRAEADAAKIDKDDLGVPPGHKIVYRDRSLDESGRHAKNAVPPKQAPVDQNGVRVVFDADAVDPTAFDAPFDDFGMGNGSAPSYSNDSRRSSDSRKNPKSAKQQQRNNGKTSGEKEKSLPIRVLSALLPWSGDSKGEVFRKILQTASIIVFVVMFAFIAQRVYQKSLLDDVPTMDSETTIDAEGNTFDPRDNYPNINFPEGLLDRFVTAYAANQDFVGWLRMQATNGAIDMPIVASSDNAEYLRKDYQGNKSDFGTPFLDMICDREVLKENNTIHGHNMKDGSQFAVLEDFIEAEAFKENPVFSYFTKYQEYRFKIYAVIITNAKEPEDNNYTFYYPYPTFMSETHFNGYVQMLDQKKLYTTGVDIQYGDTLLCLSTCHDSVYKTLRLVVVARMLREGESEAVDMSKVVVNENPRYPQVWYDKKKTTNPYKDSFRWMWNQEELIY